MPSQPAFSHPFRILNHPPPLGTSNFDTESVVKLQKKPSEMQQSSESPSEHIGSAAATNEKTKIVAAALLALIAIAAIGSSISFSIEYQNIKARVEVDTR